MTSRLQKLSDSKLLFFLIAYLERKLLFIRNRIGLQMGLRDKMGVRSRRESGKHFGYFPWGALSWWGNLLHVQGLGILKIGLEMLKRQEKGSKGQKET